MKCLIKSKPRLQTLLILLWLLLLSPLLNPPLFVLMLECPWAHSLVFFSLSTLSGYLNQSPDFKYHLYVDDLHLSAHPRYIYLSTPIFTWMCERHLKLTMSKSEFTNTPPLHQQICFFPVFPISVNVNSTLPSAQTKTLGIVFDSALSLILISDLLVIPVWFIFSIESESDQSSPSL